MFAPKVIGQTGDELLIIFLVIYRMKKSKKNFKEFCINNIDEMLPVIVDYALVSDFNCWIYLKEDSFNYEIIKERIFPN
jgi:hypothetical protein